MATAMGTTQFINAKLATDKPIFTRAKINHVPPHPVTHLIASNRRIILVLANKTIQIVDQTRSEDNLEVIDISKMIPKSKVHTAFIDPYGHHCVLGVKPSDLEGLPDLLYIPPRLNSQACKPRISSKIRGHMVTAVGWNMYNSSQVTTGPLLMGTTRGLIFEAELTTESGVFSSSIEKTWRQVYDIGYKGQVTSITALEYHCVPKSKKYFVLATTVDRLYQFQGVMTSDGEHDKPQLMSIFSDYLHKSDSFLEIKNTLKYSTISFYYQPEKIGRLAAKLPLYPWSFGWMTSDGVFHGKIDPFEEDKMLTDVKSVAFNNDKLTTPIDFILTQFHVVVAYKKFVKGICLLNEQVVFEDSLENPILGIARDAVTGTIYIFTEYTIHKYNLDQEDKHIWKVFLEMGKFDEALNYAGNDEWKTDQVLTKQGEQYMDQGLYMKAAMVFAKTKSGKIETVALKFLLTKEHEALLLYLKSRLELVKPAEKAQLTMIIVWLVELHLNKMGIANAPRQSADLTNEDIEAVADALDDQTSEELLSLMQTPKVAECVNSNRHMFYGLLASHGDKTNLIKFANVLNDHDRVIQYHLQDKEFEPILNVLETQLKRSRPELFYKYGPRLMQAIPRRFVDSVIKQGQRLEPKKILNSLLMNTMPIQEEEAIRYLEFAVDKLESMHSGVHNYLLSLYIKHKPERVWPFLEKFSGPDRIRYDVKYALRLCTDNQELPKESVYLYCVLNQLEEAVSLALKSLTLDDAKNCLKYAKSDEIKRKIWLQIAEYVVKNDNDIQSAMACLAECEDLVKIEDILPFFPDFVTIDHFKTPLCESLQKYTKHIAELKEEMNEAYKSAERIRSEMDSHKGKYTFVRATDKCDISGQFLLSKPFHVFPCCGHKFHTDRLIEVTKPHLSAAKRRKIDEILAELAAISKKKGNSDTDSIDSKSLKMSRKDMLRSELDEIIAAECINCGSIMIELIDKPFITDEEWDDVNAQWI